MESNTEKRRGYKFKFDNYDNLQVYAGTVDVNNLKTIYLDFQFWGFRIDETVQKDVRKKFSKIKRVIQDNLPENYFYDTFISIIDEPDNIGKFDKFFIKLQFTFFVKKVDISSPKKFYRDLLQPVVESVYKQEFEGVEWIKQRRT